MAKDDVAQRLDTLAQAIDDDFEQVKDDLT